MHIPNEMLNDSVCVVTATISALLTGFSAVAAYKSKDKPSNFKFAAVTALIFALQMLNYPVQYGTSGHMIGTLFAVLMLGIPYGILSMISVLLIQTVFFADGGLKEIGANSLNMVYAAVLPLMIYLSVVKKKFSDFKFYKNKTLIFVLSILSVVSASIFCVTQLYFSGLSDIKHISDSMIKVHILIGLGEGLITISLILIINALLKKFPSKPEYVFFFILIMTAIAITPAASSMPDGLEWVAQRYNFHNENAETIKLFFSDYSVGFIKNEYLSTAVSGIIGTIITFIFTYTGSLILKKSKE